MPKVPVAIVTGAGSGIGAATAVRLVGLGYAVAMVGKTESKVRQAAGGLSAKRVLVLAGDVSDPRACGSVVERTVEKFGRLDALCNVAGYAAQARIEATSDELWRRTLDSNLSGPFYLTRAAWPAFGRAGGGVVVNVSSMASLDPFPAFAAYAASKAALNMLTRITASEGERIGLRAVTIAPGAVETPMLRGIFDEKFIPREACTTPEAVAELICDCVTGKRTFAPGEVITINPPR